MTNTTLISQSTRNVTEKKPNNIQLRLILYAMSVLVMGTATKYT